MIRMIGKNPRMTATVITTVAAATAACDKFLIDLFVKKVMER